MGFSSAMLPGELIIHDTTPRHLWMPPSGNERGLELMRGAADDDYAYEGLATRFPSELLIPRSEWEPRIKEMEERKTRNYDIMMQANIPEKDQNGIPYCWIFGPVQCVEVVRCVQGQPYVSLSPASAGAPIKNFRKVGGWGKEGLAYISEHGLCPSSRWPDCAVDRRYYTEENRQIALKYRVTEWWECRPRNVDELFSLLLRRNVGACGYNWQSHETMCVDALWIDGGPATRNRNQWRGYGDRNFYILQGERMKPDDLVAPAVAMATS